MRNRWFRLFVTLIFCDALIYIPIVQAAQLSLPSGDLVAPEVSHQVISDNLEAGSSVQLKARVTDNVGVKSVTLFYRTKGTEEYNRTIMNRVGESDDYAVTLGKDALVEPGIEYYIQAMDLAGNTLLHGYSFSPLSVNVIPGALPPPTESVAATEPTEPVAPAKEEEKKSSKKTWLWIALGVLAVGAIAALASGGSDDGGGDETGTVVVTAPNP